MKPSFKQLFRAFTLICLTLLWSGRGITEKDDAHKEHKSSKGDEQDGHGVSEKISLGKAISAASGKQGIQLSEKAQKRLKLRFLSLPSSSPYTVPSSSLVFSKKEVGVYRLREGWFKFVEVEKSPSPSKGRVLIHSENLQAGDQVVVEGAPFLRIADLEAFGAEEGHGH